MAVIGTIHFMHDYPDAKDFIEQWGQERGIQQVWECGTCGQRFTIEGSSSGYSDKSKWVYHWAPYTGPVGSNG